MFRKPAAALAAMMLVVSANHATAQAVCAERAELVSRLESRYTEFPRSLGLASNGTVFEVFTSRKGTWSLPVTQPNGRSRPVAAGEAWESRPPPVKGSGA